MKRIFGSQKDFKLFLAVGNQEAILDRDAYSFIENEIFWPQFKAYLKERFNYDYEPSLGAIDYHQYAGVFQATVNRYVAYEDRILFWKVTDMFLEPEVWEFESAELAACMGEWERIRRMSLFALIRCYRQRKLK
jgi:hypothetical protein